MSTVNIAYSGNNAITLDLSSLATSSTLTAGYESSEIDNATTNKYVDCIVNVKGIVGHASTAPAIGQVIAVYVWGADTSLGTTAISALDGTGSTEDVSYAHVRNAFRLGGQAVVTVATAALTYYIMPFSVAALFGGVMPKYWGLWVTHNHTGSLGASNNSLFSYNGITYTVA